MTARLLLLTCALAPLCRAQVFVYPRRADQSHVRYSDLQWRHVDVLVGPRAEGRLLDESPHSMPRHEPSPPSEGPLEFDPAPGTGGSPEQPAAAPQDPQRIARTLEEKAGGVRLYFYESEREVAERAVASITGTYRYLVDQFQYVPTRTFPYILYNSYQEFLQTNLFPLQEGILGVTSPRDLKLTLPYLGDDRLFEEVSTHEMAHQFTIQKVRTLAQTSGATGDPLERMPLWFIEGLAELYAHRGTPPEAEMLVRDILLNPDVQRGYALLDFFEDRPFSVLWTYRAGVVRCAFLEDAYGKGFVQKVLESSVEPAGTGQRKRARVVEFLPLLEKLTGQGRREISAKFEDWLKRRAFRSYLESEQDLGDLEPLAESLGDPTDYVQQLATSPDGEMLLLRSLTQTTGDTRLLLAHRRAPRDYVTVALDGVPGIESLHPIAPRSFDLAQGRLAFLAESRARDVLYIQDFEVKSPGAKAQPGFRPRLGPRRAIPLGELGLLAAYSPALSPDGQRVALIGLSPQGIRDLYVVSLGERPEISRLTHDVYSERQVSWGPSGIVFSSNATSHGRYNLFRIGPDNPDQPERLTTEERDELDPRVVPDGRIFFVAYEGGRADLHELGEGKVIRRTNVVTGLFDISPGPEGSVFALLHHGGQRRPVRVPKETLLASEPREQPAPSPPSQPGRLSLAAAQPYKPFSPSNWELGPVFGILGGGAGGIVGQLLALSRDRLGNHALLLELNIFGSLELTEAYLLYVNQERRLTFGGGPFQALRFRRDRTFPDLALPFFSGERFFGLTGSVRYPLNRFVYAQADLGLGGAERLLLPLERRLLSNGELNGTGEDRYGAWLEANGGVRPQAEATLKLGYDTLRYHPATGPVAGSSVLLEGTLAVQPSGGQSFGNVRLDAARYFPLTGRSNFLLRGGTGTSFGGPLAREYFLSSFDTLRGVRFGDLDRLLGRDFFFSTGEVQFPLNGLLQVAILTDLEAVVGMDFGGVGQSWPEAWDRRVLDGVLGLNMGLGPLQLRLHFAKNLGLGASAGLPVPPSEWVTNFSIGIAGLDGLLGHRERMAGLHAGPRI